MNNKKLTALFLALLLAFTFVLSACSNTNDTPPPDNTEPSSQTQTEAPSSTEPATEPSGSDGIPAALANINAVLENFPMQMPNSDASISGGTLRYAVVGENAFKGVFCPLHYTDAFDSEVMQFMMDDFLSTDENVTYSQEGICTYTYDITAKTVTLTMQYDVTWHDGVPATLDDLVFAYEVVCHPDYTGVRYDDKYMNVVGAVEYNAGQADTISGLTLSEDKKSLTIEFIEFYPSLLIAGFNSSPVPRHHYEGVAVKDLESSSQIRENPIGIGPFKMVTIVPGESVEYVRFDDYWQGAPKLEGIVVEMMSATLIPMAMEEGRYDIAAFSTQQYPDYANPTNYTYLASISRAYSYTGFRLGTYDTDIGQSVYDPTMKMANLNLRKAIGYSMDNQTICDDIYNGLRFPATSIINPFHAGYIDYSVPGYLYNPEEAMRLLDEAGYVDIDGDGFREDPDGNQLTLIWAVMEGEGMDTYAAYKIQGWADVGLRVQLYNGRLTEFNAFYDMLEFDTDDGEVDMYDGAWNVGYDPNPASLWGPYAIFNYTRYTSDNFTPILANIASEQAWDAEWLAQQYSAWQYAFYEECPVIPTMWRLELQAANNRVKNYSLERKDGTHEVSLGAFHLWELTADEAYVK